MREANASGFARLKLAVHSGKGSSWVAGAVPAPASSPMDRALVPRLLTRFRMVSAAAGIAIVAALAAAYVHFGLEDSLAVDAERVTIAAARRAVFQEYIPVTGSIVPARTVYLDAVEGGQVTEVLVEEGQMVEAGQPLLELKNTDLQLRLVEAEARLTEQVNSLNLRRLQVEQTHLQLQERLIGIDEQIVTLERDLVRHERLLAAGTVATRTVEDMRTSLEALRGVRSTVLEAQRVNRNLQTSQTAQLQSSVDAIAANLGVARENLENLVMRAPIAGQLTAFEANVGEAKARGQRIGQVDGFPAFKVSAQVDEFYLGRIVLGQSASARIGGSESALEVTKIYPNVRERQFQVDLGFLSAQPEGLRRGQTLRMNLQIGAQAESLVVANGPWVDDSGGTWAFVLSPGEDIARRRAISIGRRNPDMVEILGGISDGENLIVSSYAQIGNFERIDIRGATR